MNHILSLLSGVLVLFSLYELLVFKLGLAHRFSLLRRITTLVVRVARFLHLTTALGWLAGRGRARRRRRSAGGEDGNATADGDAAAAHSLPEWEGIDISELTSDLQEDHKHPAAMHSTRAQDRTFGQKAADAAASFCGSWKFIGLYVLFTIIWCGGNILFWSFDRYPYQFYTFAVSVLAILMSALLLLAGNRQAEIDRAHAENAYNQIRQSWNMLVRMFKVLLHHTQILEQQNEVLSGQNQVLEGQTELANEQHKKLLAAVARSEKRQEAMMLMLAKALNVPEEEIRATLAQIDNSLD